MHLIVFLRYIKSLGAKNSVKLMILLLSLQNILYWINMGYKKLLFALSFFMMSALFVSAQDIIVGAARVDQYVDQLKGKKILVSGNHDWRLLEDEKARPYFEHIGNLVEIDDGALKISVL